MNSRHGRLSRVCMSFRNTIDDGGHAHCVDKRSIAQDVATKHNNGAVTEVIIAVKHYSLLLSAY